MNKEQWSNGIKNEFDFWAKWLETKGREWPDDYLFRIDPDAELQAEIAGLLADISGIPKILDVGAGPMTKLGKKMKGVAIDLTAVDALADIYGELNYPTGLPLVRTQKCDSEKLSEKFSANSFDLVNATNTLDHSYDPITAIKEMIKVTNRAVILSPRTKQTKPSRKTTKVSISGTSLSSIEI